MLVFLLLSRKLDTSWQNDGIANCTVFFPLVNQANFTKKRTLVFLKYNGRKTKSKWCCWQSLRFRVVPNEPKTTHTIRDFLACQTITIPGISVLTKKYEKRDVS